MTEIMVVTSDYEDSETDETQNEGRSGIIEIPGLGTLDDYHFSVTSSGGAISLEVMAKYALLGEQRAIDYLDNAAATDRLLKVMNPLEDKMNVATTMKEVEAIKETLILEVQFSDVPAMQKQAIIDHIIEGYLYKEAKARLSDTKEDEQFATSELV